MPSISDILGSTKANASRIGPIIKTAVNQAAQGDIQGAVSSIITSGQDALQSLGGTGGVTPGDDFAGIMARGDAVPAWSWYAMMPDISDGNGVDLGTTNGVNLGQPVVSLPWYYVAATNLPLRNIRPDSVRRNGHDVMRPDSYEVESLQVGLFVDSKNLSMQYTKAWQGLVLNNRNPKLVQNQGLWGYPKTYCRDIIVYVLSVKRNVLLQVRYINCWPTQITSMQLDSNNEALVHQVTFAVEDVDVTVNNDQGLIDTLSTTASNYLTGAAASALNGLF